MLESMNVDSFLRNYYDDFYTFVYESVTITSNEKIVYQFWKTFNSKLLGNLEDIFSWYYYILRFLSALNLHPHNSYTLRKIVNHLYFLLVSDILKEIVTVVLWNHIYTPNYYDNAHS